MRFRNTHPAFEGEFSLPEYGERQFTARWKKGDEWTELAINFTNDQVGISYETEAGTVAKDCYANLRWQDFGAFIIDNV